MNILKYFILISAISFTTYLSAQTFVLVEENHAVIEKDGISYILDSYIIMFEQPYYILVRRADNEVVNKKLAEEIAVEYILPRGCTEPLVRRPELDRINEAKTQLVIGVAC